MVNTLVLPFGAGILSFLSPCVLPLLPGYLAFLAGPMLAVTHSDPLARWRVIKHAFWFVLGCGVVLVFLGAAAAMIGAALRSYQVWFERVGGLLLIVFGLALTGRVPIPFLSRDYHVRMASGAPVWWRSGLVGLAFGLSWSACAGPVLGAMLAVTAVRSRDVTQGMTSMLVFAFGQGLPFLLLAAFIDGLGPVLRRIRPYTVAVSYVGAVVIILMGLVLLSGQFNQGFE
jgi:cytochrome c-type biogenesis protein